MRFGGPYSSIQPSLHRPYADEFNLGAEFVLAPRTFAGIHLFRRDEKQRLAVINTGVPPSAFEPVTILDPGPDGVAGTFDDRPLVVYAQNPNTLGRDQYLLTNPGGLRTLNTGFQAEIGAQWRGLLFHTSFVAEKSYGPTNPGNAVFENDPSVVGALFADPNTAIRADGRSFTDRAYVGKMQASYRVAFGMGRLRSGKHSQLPGRARIRAPVACDRIAAGPLPGGSHSARKPGRRQPGTSTSPTGIFGFFASSACAAAPSLPRATF